MQKFFGFLLRFVPKNTLSYWVGKLVHLRLPAPLNQWSIRAFAWKYNINLEEAEHPAEHYKSIGELFTRKLKEGVRPIMGDVYSIHPCDSELTSFGPIESETLLQAKGKRYSVEEFLVDKELAGHFSGGHFFTYYLCPTDYHRVHSPVEGVVKKIIHVPGRLWPVNEWSVSTIDKLFAINERIVVEIETRLGPVAVVLVGATNVGQISLAFDKEVRSNLFERTEPLTKEYSEPIKIFAGSELGTFHMGSTAIVLYPKKAMSSYTGVEAGPVKIGQAFLK